MGKRVLVVDDDPTIVELVAKILSSHGYAISRAANGKEALHSVETERPDVILLDIMMPGADGMTILAELRRKRSLQGTRLVMMTARSSPKDVDEANHLGADFFLSKPFTAKQLLDGVSQPGPEF